MNIWVYDIETTSPVIKYGNKKQWFCPSLVKSVHTICMKKFNEDYWDIYDENDKGDMSSIAITIKEADVLICHNQMSFDLEVLRLFGIIPSSNCKIIDTLAICRKIHPDKKEGNGLEAWGEFFGIPKPEIPDWDNLSNEEYVHRCVEDVKINEQLMNYLINEGLLV